MNFSQLTFGMFSFKIYGFFIACAFVLSGWYYYKTLKRKEFPVDFFLHSFWKWVMSGIVLGRIFAIILNWGIIERNGIFSFFAFWDGELNFIGMSLGMIGMMYYELQKRKMDFIRWIDAAITPFLFGVLILDIAAFLTGALYGRETTMPWGIQYETFSVDILSPVHPVTIYAFLLHLPLYFWAKRYVHVYERLRGRLAIRAGIFFFLIDLFLQFFRGDPTLYILGTIRIEVLFDILILIFLFSWGHKNKIDKF